MIEVEEGRLHQAARVSVERLYRGLFRELGLTTEDAAPLLERLAAHQMRVMATANSRRLTRITDSLRSANAELDADMQKLLGAERFERFKSYRDRLLREAGFQ